MVFSGSFLWLAPNLDVATGSRVLVTFFAIFGSIWAAVPALSHFLRVRRAVSALSSRTIDTRNLPSYLLPSPGLIRALTKALDEEDFDTVIVYGERGSGKTTAIEKGMENRLGVIEWTMAAADGADATLELRENGKNLFSPWSKPEDFDFGQESVCPYC